jgi:hypothetical protein
MWTQVNRLRTRVLLLCGTGDSLHLECVWRGNSILWETLVLPLRNSPRCTLYILSRTRHKFQYIYLHMKKQEYVMNIITARSRISSGSWAISGSTRSHASRNHLNHLPRPTWFEDEVTEDGDNRLLRNIDESLRDYTTTHSRRQWSTWSAWFQSF